MIQSELPEQIFHNSVLVATHPDDESLWFGSIGASVTTIVICFMDDPTNPGLIGARQSSLAEHPWRDRIEILGLQETHAFNGADWSNPELTDAGLRITRDEATEQTYRECAAKLRELLTPHIASADNIFTHNPWGEYGHEEHVLVHRVTTSLAENNATAIWYNNYVSNWSKKLMSRYSDGASQPCYRMPIDRNAVAEIADIYRRHGAWTWLDDFEWFPDECFVKGPLSTARSPSEWLGPVNMLHLPDRKQPHAAKPRSVVHRAARRIKRLLSLFSIETTSNK